MKRLSEISLHVALIHHPVVNKSGETITSAVTNLDLHDIARVMETYGGESYFLVTPLTDQQVLTRRIVDHWIKGEGARMNPARTRAVRRIRICASLAEAVDRIEEIQRVRPVTVATCARNRHERIGYAQLRSSLASGRPHLLLFGTAWGLAEECLQAADFILEPIHGRHGYNHLSVRSAAAIILDRLLGERG